MEDQCHLHRAAWEGTLVVGYMVMVLNPPSNAEATLVQSHHLDLQRYFCSSRLGIGYFIQIPFIGKTSGYDPFFAPGTSRFTLSKIKVFGL